MGKVVAICNQKGGVGKTTTAINLSAYLAILHKKILLIDMDPQGNATSGLSVDKAVINNSMYGVLLGNIQISEAVKRIHIDNFFIAPSNLDLTGLEIELVGAVAREFKLKNALKEVAELYDYIIIDTPPSLGLLTINSLTACDSLLVPLQCEYYALEGLTKLLETIKLVRDNLNAEIKMEGIILTMADFRTKLTHEVINEIRSHFGEKVFKTIVPRNIRLSEAPSYGLPVALYDETSVGAQKYKELAEEMLERHTIISSEQKEADEKSQEVSEGEQTRYRS